MVIVSAELRRLSIAMPACRVHTFSIHSVLLCLIGVGLSGCQTIGYYAQAQLSVINVLTFSNALIGEFRWEFFLMEPMIFLLWCSVAGSLLFWGRGVRSGQTPCRRSVGRW